MVVLEAFCPSLTIMGCVEDVWRHLGVSVLFYAAEELFKDTGRNREHHSADSSFDLNID